MCSGMASELRYALDCGNGNKKPSRKALCRRQGQHSSLSIVSEEGKYAACNKYRYFVGKAPLTWTKGRLAERKGRVMNFFVKLIASSFTCELKHTWSVNSKHGRNEPENDIAARIIKRITSNYETTFKCNRKKVSRHRTIVAWLNLVKFRVTNTNLILHLPIRKKERRQKLLASRGSCKFVATGIRDLEATCKKKQGLDSNRVRLSFFYESPLNNIVHHLVPREVC